MTERSSFHIYARHGKVIIEIGQGETLSLERAEALEVAADLLSAVQLSGDISDAPSDLISIVDTWRARIEKP